jgi:hypothetical protein
VTQATALPRPSLSPGVLEWGHPLVTPDGQTIRVPAFVFRKLRLLGALLGNSNRLSSKIYQFIRPEFDCISEGLGRLLGEDLSGPAWVVCRCKACQREISDIDKTPLPGRNRLQDDETSRIVAQVRLEHQRKRECRRKSGKIMPPGGLRVLPGQNRLRVARSPI